jgi:hypothetical protein
MSYTSYKRKNMSHQLKIDHFIYLLIRFVTIVWLDHYLPNVVELDSAAPL